MKTPQIIKRYPGRRIHCGNEVWFWFVEKENVSARNGRTGQRRNISIFQLTGIDPTVYKVSVKPKLIATWLTVGDDNTFTPYASETAESQSDGYFWG